MPGKQQVPGYRAKFVYVLVNPEMPGLVKIGWSGRLPEDRAHELSRTAVPLPYQVAYRTRTLKHEAVEKRAHQLLVDYRVSSKREFFRVPEATAVQAVQLAQEQVTGIASWAPSPHRHPVSPDDRVVIPLRAGQIFALIAYSFPSDDAPEIHDIQQGDAEGNVLEVGEPEILDIWQAHADGDVLEISGADHPGHVAGFSNQDPGGDDDPVPYLDRYGEVRNGTLIGRERLAPGTRLVWLGDIESATHCESVIFEAYGHCQVVCRTWNPQPNPFGMPLLLNDLVRDPSPAMAAALRRVLDLDDPPTRDPRNPDPQRDWATAAADLQPPEYWMPQLKHRPKK
ncbi:GIY-YIG nuclease family protein [Kitasatospora sp. NPDC088351]|uniref:GIY-YIG nuclease family protein n=1 Tax=Kitasatospora sp. NPDC088351 TaxID=3155180 RepID=UPI0034341417